MVRSAICAAFRIAWLSASCFSLAISVSDFNSSTRALGASDKHVMTFNAFKRNSTHGSLSSFNKRGKRLASNANCFPRVVIVMLRWRLYYNQLRIIEKLSQGLWTVTPKNFYPPKPAQYKMRS